jgi:transposase InsO family protein
MRQHGLRARAPRRYRVCTTDSKHSLPVAANLLDQNFVADRPNQVWLADITYIPTSEGWLYLAVILDLFTRKVVGWAMRDHMRAELTIAALTMAIQRQRPGAGLIHHSDRGSQGGINWSSQHNREECCDGRETAVGSSVTGQVEVARAAGDGAT